MRWSAIGVIALASALSGGAASAEPDNHVRAEKLFGDGRTYLSNKEFELACTAFEASEKAEAAIGTALNIALCYEQWGHLAAAYTAYQEAERFAKLRFDDRSKVARDKLAELEPKVPHLAIDVPQGTDPSTVFVFDGKEIERMALVGDRRVEIGDHVIEVRVPGKPPVLTHVTVVSGDRKQLTVDVPKAAIIEMVAVHGPRKAGRLYGGVAAGAGGVAAIAIGSLVALGARNDYDAAVKACPMLACESRTADDKANDARTRANEMTFVIGGGALLVAAGVYLVATSGGEVHEESRTALRVVPAVSASGVGVAIGGGW
jgi:tetratricopeptide (TPR) repeat protein|nr:hypothetical protein [Kofleriaceae bacterium]